VEKREKERREKLICYLQKNCCWMSVVSYLKIQLKETNTKCQSSLVMAGGDFKMIKIKAKPIRVKTWEKFLVIFING
jgi:hypothetical protein